jgi:hypothetical protein
VITTPITIAGARATIARSSAQSTPTSASSKWTGRVEAWPPAR